MCGELSSRGADLATRGCKRQALGLSSVRGRASGSHEERSSLAWSAVWGRLGAFVWAGSSFRGRKPRRPSGLAFPAGELSNVQESWLVVRVGVSREPCRLRGLLRGSEEHTDVLVPWLDRKSPGWPTGAPSASCTSQNLRTARPRAPPRKNSHRYSVPQRGTPSAQRGGGEGSRVSTTLHHDTRGAPSAQRGGGYCPAPHSPPSRTHPHSPALPHDA